MALILDEDFNFKNNTDAYEKSAYFFYRIERLANTAIEVNGLHHGDFEDSNYRSDCVYYQLEAIRDLARQFEKLFNDVACNLGRESDAKLEAFEGGPNAEAALLAKYRSASKEDQDFILIYSRFMARKGWTETMRDYLSELARLCVDEVPDGAAPTTELIQSEAESEAI